MKSETARAQAKLRVGAVDDPLETEAARTAEQVLHQPGNGGMAGAGQQRAAESLLTRTKHSLCAFRAGSRDSSTGLAGAGRPLESSLREFFEPRFGFDFSRVRIFSNQEAAESAHSLGARAYTAGANIAFAEGKYQPGTSEGRRLLAHELTHVLQQEGHTPGIDGRGIKVAAGRPTPAIQRDADPDQQNMPPDATKQGGPLSITKRYDPTMASRAEVVQALTDYLYRELRLQGSRHLGVTERVRSAVLKLFQPIPGGDPGDPDAFTSLSADLSKTMPGTPEEFAAKVGAWLPESISRNRMMHLYGQPAKTPKPSGLKPAIGDVVGKIGKIPEDVRKPSDEVEAPGTTPTMGSSPGQHSVKTPERSFGGGERQQPKPNLPEAPLASEQDAVVKIIQELDDDALIPAAAKGSPQAGGFIKAKDFARRIANQLAAAQASKQDTVVVTLGPSYRHLEHLDDLIETFDKAEQIVRQIAAALEGGVENVKKVTITPGREKGDKIPPQRDVLLQGGD
ncbi:MAG TPA: DUF4157 domain-containing protein [Bryobacteraceae bacterium]